MQNPELVPQFLDRAIATQTQPVKTETYKAIRILHWEPETFDLEQSAINIMAGAIADPNPADPNPTDPDPAPDTAAPPVQPIVIPGWSLAYLPSGYVIGTEKPDTIKAIVDQLDQPRFSTSPAFQKLTQNPQYPQALIAGVGDYSKFIPVFTAKEGAETAAPQSPFPGMPTLPIDPIDLAKSIAAIGNTYDSFSGLLWAAPNGLRIQSSVTLKTPLPPQPATTSDSTMLSQVPANSYGVISAKDGLAGLAKTLNFDPGIPNADGKSPVLNPAAQIFAGPLQQFSQKLLGIDSQDITPWIDREIALFAFPTQQGFFPEKFQVDVSLGAVIQTSDRTLAENTIKKVTRHLQEQNPQSIQSASTQINGNEVISLNTIGNPKAPAQNLLSYSWIKPDTVLIQSGIDPLLIPQPWQPLANSPNFQDAIAPLPKSDQGYFYLNGSSSNALIFNSLLPKFFGQDAIKSPFVQSIQATLGSIRSIAASTTATGTSITTDGVMLLNRSSQPPLKTAADWAKAGQQQASPTWAIANYSQAIQVDASNPTIYLDRGKARAQTQDFRGSLNDFDQALALTPPTNTDLRNQIYNHRAQSYLARFQYKEAIADLSRNIQNQIDRANSYNDRATAYLAIGNYKAAFDDATQAIQIQATATSYLNRCYANARLGAFQTAAQDCQQAQEYDPATLPADNPPPADPPPADRLNPHPIPGNPESINCYVAAGLGKTDAIDQCQTALESDAENPYNYENQGLAFALLKQPKLATQSFQQALDRFQKQGDRIGADRVTRLLQTLK
ncbi:MAG: DUF3352 domain-containing protein [Alkalinema sp. RL_2_19]|nr:DUF3352 domain-containing protein [Alkalinema sp. RL_2_19]